MKALTEIRTEVITRLKTMLRAEDISLEAVDIVKLNDLIQYGIAFKTGDIGKTLYVNEFAADGKTADDIADEMLVAYENSADAPWELTRTIGTRQALASLKDKLFVALLEVKRNENYLRNVLYKEVGHGLAFICQIRHMNISGHGFMSAAVTNDLARSNAWDKDDLFNIAIQNTLVHDAPRLCRMEDTLLMERPDNLLGSDTNAVEDLLILTNTSGFFGAASLFLPNIINNIHACLQSGFYAIPSSTHEYIVVPESENVRLEALSAMCREANETVVELKDILSDHVLYFPMK